MGIRLRAEGWQAGSEQSSFPRGTLRSSRAVSRAGCWTGAHRLSRVNKIPQGRGPTFILLISLPKVGAAHFANEEMEV